VAPDQQRGRPVEPLLLRRLTGRVFG
jgi:hypothetical protein